MGTNWSLRVKSGSEASTRHLLPGVSLKFVLITVEAQQSTPSTA